MEELENSQKEVTVLEQTSVFLAELDALPLARWQFGLTTIYHFLFVPLTIGVVFFVAALAKKTVRIRA